MILNVKNFENEERRIKWQRNGDFLNVFYYRKEGGRAIFDQVFMKCLENRKDLKQALVELLQKVEKHYKIELLKIPYENFSKN